MPKLNARKLHALADAIITAENSRLDAMAAELRNRVNELVRVLVDGLPLPDIKEAIHYLLDAEYELTGDSDTFGFLYDQYGITDTEYERHFERVEAARKAAKNDATAKSTG